MLQEKYFPSISVRHFFSRFNISLTSWRQTGIRDNLKGGDLGEFERTLLCSPPEHLQMHLTLQYNCPLCTPAQPAVLPCMLPVRHGGLPPPCCHLRAATPRDTASTALRPMPMERTKPDTVRVDCAEEREDSIQQRTKTYEQKVQGQECEM